MYKPPDPPACLPLDLDQVQKHLPTLISISTELDAILNRYCELNRLFRQHFLSLFEGHSSVIPVHERTRAALNRLHDLTRNANLIDGPLYWLELNNDRAALACDMLNMLFSTPLGSEKANNNEEAPY